MPTTHPTDEAVAASYHAVIRTDNAELAADRDVASIQDLGSPTAAGPELPRVRERWDTHA